MKMQITCPKCAGTLAVEEEQAGSEIRCPACQQAFPVPSPPVGEGIKLREAPTGPAPVTGKPGPAAMPWPARTAPAAGRPRMPNPNGPPQWSPVRLIVRIVVGLFLLGLLGIGVCVWAFSYLLESSTRNPPGQSQSVKKDTPLLRPDRSLDMFHTVVFSRDSKNALVFFPGGKMKHFPAPGLAPADYNLPDEPYEAALDASGVLYVAGTKRRPFDGSPGLGSRRGSGDLSVFNVADLLAGKGTPGAALQPTKVIPIQTQVESLTLSPAGDWLYYLDTKRKQIARVNTAQGKTDADLAGQKPEIHSLCLSPDGKSLYAAAKDVVQKFDTATGKLQKNFPVKCHPSDIQAADDGRVFINSADDQWTQITLLDTNGPGRESPGARIYHSDSILLSPDQKFLYVSCWKVSPASITCWRVPANPESGWGEACAECRLNANGSAVGKIYVRPDGKSLFCDAGRTLRLFE
jgi:hypothetical protein